MTPRSNPFANRTAASPAPEAPADAPQPVVTPKAYVARSGKAYPPKVTFYQDPETTARMRGCFEETRVKSREGDRSLSEFIHKAVMAEVERRERKYNDGAPFNSVDSGDIPRGRPVGE